MTKIYLGADHRGFELKEKVKEWLKEWGYEYEDMGAFEYNKDDDYPDFATAAAKAVALSLSKGQPARGILICGSGIGVTVVANKIKGIIAGTMASSEQAKASVSDENTNIIGLSADYFSEENNKKTVRTFLETEFSGAERHIRRVNKIKKIEEELR